MLTKNILLTGTAFAAGFLLTKLLKQSKADIHYLIEKAFCEGVAEIQNSKVALEKSNSTNVKIFSQRMIDDHIALNQALSNIATTKGISIPNIEQYPNKIEPYKAVYRNDENFDESYVDHQLNAHKDIIKLFRKIRTSDDPDISQFAARTLEQLNHHLRMAQDLADTFHSNNIPTSSSHPDFVEEPNYKM